MTDQKYTHGRFVWHELMTTDVAKSKKFYADLFGWTFEDAPMPDGTYTLVNHGDRQHAGMFDIKQTGMPGMPANWMLYVSSPNVDEALAAATANGGKVIVPVKDIPDVGRFGGVMDAQGAATMAFKGAKGDPTPYERPPVGAFCWDQLNTTDVDAAKTFYAKLYGWTNEAFNGQADISTFKSGDVPVASVMKAPEGVPAHWLTYVAVSNLAEARTKAEKLGAKILMAEIPVPTVGTIAVISDDVGANIGLFQPEG